MESRRLFDARFCVEMKASLCCWFCDVTAFTQSLIRLDNLSQPVLRRESSVPSGSLENEFREQEERESAHWHVVLNSPIWTRPQAAARISVCGGRSPAHVQDFLCKAHDHPSSDILFNVKDIHRYFISVVNLQYDAKV